MIVRTDEHTQALLSVLQATGRPVGDAVAPPAASAPYVVLYPQSGTRGGPIADPDADAALTYQFTCVGRDRRGAQWLADRVADVVRNVAFPGRALLRVQLLNDSPVERDDDVTPPLWYATPVYQFWTTPA